MRDGEAATLAPGGATGPAEAWSRPISVDTLLSNVWQFSHASGMVAAPALRFMADGTVGGYDYVNEARWVLVGERVAFAHENGAVSTIFDRTAVLGDGTLELRGRFLLRPDMDLVLVLRQVPDATNRDVPALMRVILKIHIDLAGWEIGDHSFGHPNAVIVPPWKLVVGRYCAVAGGVTMVSTYHRMDTVSIYPFKIFRQAWPNVPDWAEDCVTKGDIVVGNDVWIGYGAFVCSGVTIGDGAVVGAMSVVTRDVPPYAVVGGNPARIIRYRFAPEVIGALLRLRWWDWPDAKVEAFLPLMMSGDMQHFLDVAAGCGRRLYAAG